MEILPTFADASFDSIVTDPPYELGFMGKGWDSSGIAYDGDVWRECLRVLKPGGHLLAFGGSRTWHRMAVAIEDAGFEMRDSIAWLYGSGFPKSLDVSKAIDKAAGAEREVIGKRNRILNREPSEKWVKSNEESRIDRGESGLTAGSGVWSDVTRPATAEAREWEGWGTALKPAFEPIVVARKPLRGTVVANVLAYGTGALNIDASRVAAQDSQLAEKYASVQKSGPRKNSVYGTDDRTREGSEPNHLGRFPANVLLDESQAVALDKQSGKVRGFATQRDHAASSRESGSFLEGITVGEGVREGYNDTGGASRFFPVFTAPPSELPRVGDVIRSMGQPTTVIAVEQREPTLWAVLTEHPGGREEFLVDTTRPFPTFRYEAKAPTSERPNVEGTVHATVKPLALIRWLVRLVTRPGGRVLDLYAGSGTTGEAALLEGMEVDLIELEESHLPLILARVRKPLHPAMFGDWEDAS
ncbi:DNA methyltransferase [uncultured Microbacterium sp.]|uniref:DNA methyltransferase n=1 Tax=uncultured Microbacterium sp. TaxID=191216 RepID=UPI0025CFC3AB|nr:DNA methyltransferase [uncultured Microbacterium sp.]